jgi:hypothetical protein
MASGLPGRDSSMRRQEVMARLAATAEAVRALDDALQAEPGLPADAAAALINGARALVPVAVNTGVDYVVSAGPAHEWMVHVQSGPAGPGLTLERATVDQSTSVTPPDGVAARLADLLRGGSTEAPR